MIEFVALVVFLGAAVLIWLVMEQRERHGSRLPAIGRSAGAVLLAEPRAVVRERPETAGVSKAPREVLATAGAALLVVRIDKRQHV